MAGDDDDLPLAASRRSDPWDRRPRADLAVADEPVPRSIWQRGGREQRLDRALVQRHRGVIVAA
jgi:hypothetical protein